MLLHLEISNIALIEKVSIDFEEGLNIMTGETGAGKSIIIDSINALLGQRTSRDIIRTGEEKATVEGIFQTNGQYFDDLLDNYGIIPEEDGTLLLTREFTVAGRNVCRANGKMITVSILKKIGENLIDVHGQHDTQSLFYQENHLKLLDAFAGKKLEELKEKYRIYFEEYETLFLRIKELSGDTIERERKIDLMKYEINEIDSTALKTGEYEGLVQQRTLLSNGEKIITSLQDAYESLFAGTERGSSAVNCANDALGRLASISGISQTYSEIHSRLADILYTLEDVTHDIRKQSEQVNFDEGLLEQTEKRIDVINNLKRKYGSTIEEIMDYCEKTKVKLDEILNNGKIVIQLRKDMSLLEEKIFEIAKQLNIERKNAADILQSNITDELKDLQMQGAQFEVNITSHLDRANINLINYRNGLDKAEFLISPNKGEPLKELIKIASGGELSRIMLAIKKILADVDEIPTLIFDEIDMGISGIAATQVGKKLKFISASHQVICVTHLAQIACMADKNFKIEKIEEQDRTITQVEKLSGETVFREIARMMGSGENTELSLKHAEEMVNRLRMG